MKGSKNPYASCNHSNGKAMSYGKTKRKGMKDTHRKSGKSRMYK